MGSNLNAKADVKTSALCNIVFHKRIISSGKKYIWNLQIKKCPTVFLTNKSRKVTVPYPRFWKLNNTYRFKSYTPFSCYQ